MLDGIEHREEEPVGCEEEGCDQPRRTRGLCGRHYSKRLRDGTLVRLSTNIVCIRCSREFVGDGRRKYCDPCRVERKRENRANEATNRWREKNPERHRRIRRSAMLKHKYGITLEQYEEMLEAQDGRCALSHCDRPADRVDHCHYTHEVRGLVCHRCNLLLAGLEDPIFREAAARYLGLEVKQVSIIKHGTGEVLRDEKQRKQAAKDQDWSQADEDALEAENDQADQ